MLATAPVTGFVSLADDGRLTDACLVFQLDKPAFDAATGAIVASEPIAALVGEDGRIETRLWPNVRGTVPTTYRVSLVGRRDSAQPVRHDLGTTTIPEAGGDVSELLSLVQAGIEGVVATVLSLGEYNAVIAAASDLQDTLDCARDWATSETEVEEGFLSARSYALESAASAERSAEIHSQQTQLLMNSIGMRIFDTPEAGFAGAFEGEQFQVPVGQNLMLYRHEGYCVTPRGYLGQIAFDNFAELDTLSYDIVAAGTVVRADAFRYEIAAPDAEDHHIEAASVKLYALPTPEGAFTARQFGAVEDSDITDALQAAIDAALYNVDRSGAYMADVLVDIHKGTISRTIHCSYGGHAYKSIRVRGFGQTYSNTERSFNGTILSYTARTGSAFAIQGGRKPVLSDMTICGAAQAALKGMNKGKAGGAGAGFLSPPTYDGRTWDGAAFAGGVVFNRRYDPYAAVAIDPRSGDRPADRAITAVAVGSPAVITTAAAHDLNSNAPETVIVSGLSGAGLPDGEYYAIYVSNTEAELWALDWSATNATAAGTGTLAYPYPEAPHYPVQEAGQDPDAGKKRTSAFVIERLTIQGFEVGTVINPGTQGSNGDFGEFAHVDTGQCKFGHAVCQANARINHYYRCNPATVFCFLTTARFGVAGGNANAKVEGMGGGYMVKWFEAPATTRFGTTTFDNCHPEGVGMLGTLYTGGSSSQPIVFQNSIVKFEHSHGAPASVLENFGGDPCPVTFVGCEIRSNRGLSFGTGNLELTGTQMNRMDPILEPYQAQSFNNAHIVASTPRTCLGSPVSMRYDISSCTFTDSVSLGAGLTLTGREHGIPCGARLVSRGARSESPGMPLVVPPFDFAIGSGQRSFGPDPIGARSLTFTFASYTGTRMRLNGLAPGCVLVDTGCGTRMVIASVDYATGEITVELESNWYDDGAGTAGLFDPDWDWTANTWAVHRTDLFTPPSRILGDFTAGSDVVTNLRTVGRLDEADFGLGVGDWLAGYYLDAPGVFLNDDTSITAIDTGAGTLTLASAARADASGVALDYWFRALPGA